MSKREIAEKCRKSVPKCLLGLPGSLPEKCPKSVWKVSWCWGWRWKNVQKMSKKCLESVLCWGCAGKMSGTKTKEKKKRKKEIKTRNCLKMSKKCPKMPFGASWQPPRKMSKKCLESVLVLGLALEKCPENVQKVSPRHFLANRGGGLRPQGGARASRARAPFWFSICQKVSKKCLENVWGIFF